jgi:hypothetical protein
MHWIAPSEKDTVAATLEKQLWDAADQFRANSGLKAQEYSGPILGLIFLRFAELRFAIQHSKLEASGSSARRGSRVDEPSAYHAEGILFLSAEARFDYLLTMPESANIGAKVNAAMREIEKHNPQLAGVLPKTYRGFCFSALICSDLTNIAHRHQLCGNVDALFILEWNSDTKTFASLVEATANDLHAFVAQVNNRTYGDSRLRAPAVEDYLRDVVQVKGGVSDYYVLGEIDFLSLRKEQMRAAKKPKFKPTPIGYKMSSQRKK